MSRVVCGTLAVKDELPPSGFCMCEGGQSVGLIVHVCSVCSDTVYLGYTLLMLTNVCLAFECIHTA